jgi:hypothetical protein
VKVPEVSDGKNLFEALWVNGRRATRARTPNQGYFQASGVVSTPLPGVKPAAPLERSAIAVPPENAASLANLTPEEQREANTVVLHSWSTSRHRFLALDAAKGELMFTGYCMWPFFHLEPYHRLYFENYRAALDAAGEWFLARDGQLSYMPQPDEDPAKAEVIVPVAKQWLRIVGDAGAGKYVEHLYFKGLQFHFQAFELPGSGWSSIQADPELGSAIELRGARHVVFEECEFAHTITHTMRIHEGCQENRIVRSHFHDLGGGAIYIGETKLPEKDELKTGQTTIEDCIIHAGGRYFAGSCAVWAGHSGGNVVRHTEIADFFYIGVSLGWTWGYVASPAEDNHVEFSYLHHLGQGMLSDLAAIYTLGPQPGTTIRNNVVHDISCGSYGGWGLYNDEGSTGVVWENNLVYQTQSGGYHQHYGKENIVRNNIFAFAKDFQIRRSRKEDHLAFTFERNIVLFEEGKLFGHLDDRWHDGKVKLAHNLYWKLGGQPFDFAGKDWSAWQQSSGDAGSVIADPLFLDPRRATSGFRKIHPL